MFRLIKNEMRSSPEIKMYNIQGRSFAFGKWNLYRFRRDTNSYDLKDFTKNTTSKEWMSKKLNEEKAKLKTYKLSSLLQTEDKNKLKKLNPIIKPNKRQFNKFLRKSAMKKIELNEIKNIEELSQRFFEIDHTAQVLENIRNEEENKIFNKKLHVVREKKLALKLESRKAVNLLENYTENFVNSSNNTYNLLHFSPIGRREIGSKIEEKNQANVWSYNTNLNTNTKIEYLVDNQHSEYVNNKLMLKNNRIDSMLNSKKSNPDLHKYLSYENKPNNTLSNSISLPSISETLNKSSDEISLSNQSLSKSLENFFEPQIDLTTKIQKYEEEVYNEYKKLDLYNKYSIGITKFGNLTLSENLNYIKFNITNSKDLFKMYKEVIHTDFTNKSITPQIFSALLHKLAIGYKKEEDVNNLFSMFDYKDLLKNVKKSIKSYNYKDLVNNLWSIAKIHKYNRTFSCEFFQHLLNEFIDEFLLRNFKDFQQISFLLEGLNYLNIDERKDDKIVVKKEQALADKIYFLLVDDILTDNSNLENFHPFNLAKILNYYFHINLKLDQYNNLLKKSSKYLLDYIVKNEYSLMDLIQKHDFIKIVRALSWGIQKLNSSNINNIQKDIDQSQSLITVINITNINTSSIELYREIMERMSPIITIAYNRLELQDCSELIYHYSNAGINNEIIYQYLQVQITNKLEMMEDFKLKDILQYTYGISKLKTRKIFPDFNADPLNVIFPNLNEKFTNAKFLNMNKFKQRMFEKQNILNVSNLSIICYCASLMGYLDIDFYLPILHNIITVDQNTNLFKNQINPIKLQDIGYLTQCLSLLNYNDMSVLEYLCNRFALIINSNDEKENFNFFSISQVLSAVVNLSIRRNIFNIKNWKKCEIKLMNYLYHNLQEPGHIVSCLWYYTYFESMEDFFYYKLCELLWINEKKLSFYGKVVLNQVIIYNYTKNNLLYSEFTREFIKELNDSSIEFENKRKNIQKKISQEKFQKYSFVEKIIQITRNNEKLFINKGFPFVENFIISESYVCPLYFPNKKLCLLFYDHSEKMKNKNLNGYNTIKEDIFYELGYKIERIYADECDKIIDNDEDLLNLLIKKIN